MKMFFIGMAAGLVLGSIGGCVGCGIVSAIGTSTVNVDPVRNVREVVAPPQSPGADEVIFIGGDQSPDRRGDIVFVHGLDGDPHTTWGNPNDDFYWPRWLHENHKDVGVWTVKYDAASSAWYGNPMGIGDRSESMLRQFRHNKIGERPVVLVCHSLGGIVAKRMIVDSTVRTQDYYVQFINQIKGVAFLATPHSGSDAGTLTKLVKVYQPSQLVPSLEKDDDELRNLNTTYREIVPRKNIGTLPFVEKANEPGVGRVVTESSGDPGIVGVVPMPIGRTHRQIAKPPSAKDDVVREVESFIEKYLLAPPKPDSTSIEEFLMEFHVAKMSTDISTFRSKFNGKQFTWNAVVQLAIPQKDSELLSYPILTIQSMSSSDVIAAAFPRFSSSFRELPAGQKIKIRGTYNEASTFASLKLKNCELLPIDAGE